MNYLWRNGELEVNVYELFWNGLNCVYCWEWYEYGICWVEDQDIELYWWVRNNLNYWDCRLEFVDMDWNDKSCELFVLWMVMS